MTQEEIESAVSEIGDVLRMRTSESVHAMHVLALTIGYEACIAKNPSISYEEMEEWVVNIVRLNTRMARIVVEKQQPAG